MIAKKKQPENKQEDTGPKIPKYRISIYNTGIGIPQKSTDRVFERFYRVDKSRSKQTGGTGLGLAIVKHIVAKHNAKITLSSELGKGTTITVIFPKNTLQTSKK